MIWRRVALAVAAGAIAVVATLDFGSRFSAISSTSADVPRPADALSDAQIDLLVLAQLGVSPRKLVLAGCSPAQCGNLVTSIRSRCQALRSELRTALNNTDAGSVALRATVASVREQTVDIMNPDHRSILIRLGQNSSRAVPDEVKILQRTEAEWRAIEGAYASRRASQRVNRELPAAAATLIAATESEPAVQAARLALHTSLEAARVAWNTAITSELPR